MNIITEGSAKLKVQTPEIVSRSMEVFYNPIMKFNRDLSILILQSIPKKDMQIVLPLAGSGVRGIRFLKELKKNKIKSISFNDYDSKSIRSIKNNLKLNKINKKIKISNCDANLFLVNSMGFDYIDVDPFGTSNPFLDSSIKRMSRGGILAITNTDTAALAGTYPKTCVRKYWAVPKKGYMMHEHGLRILIRKIQLIGMQYDKALTPIFSYFKDHYFRVFFKCVKGKKEADKIAKQHGFFNEVGPMWDGDLWDKELVKKMCKNADSKNKELLKFLKIIKEESKISSVGFYDIHKISKTEKIKIIMKKEDVIKKIKKQGFKASETHFSGTSIRTDMSYERFLKTLKG